MTREEIRDLVVEATGRTDKTSLINSAINIALEELSSRRSWSDLLVNTQVSLDEGEVSVDLASNTTRLIETRIVDVSGSPASDLKIKQKTWIVKRFPNPPAAAAGRPIYGYLEGQTLYFIPVTNAAYDLKYSYYRLHPALTSDSDSVLIRGASSAIVAYTVYWVFQSLERNKEAQVWFGTYATKLAAAMKVDRDNTVVLTQATPRGPEPPIHSEYYLDPFVMEMP